jgi:hypothetical protein
MPIRRIAAAVGLALGLAGSPLSAANAQYYSDCNPFPLSWPFCIAGAAVGTAAAIATLPFRAIAGSPYYYYGTPYYSGYYGTPYYYGRAYHPVHHHHRRHHHST